MLNDRFRGARATNNLTTAGVIVRGLDSSSDPDRPWMACTTNWCARHGDHFSTSLVYPGHAASYGPIGFVIDPTLVELNCAQHPRCVGAYPGDGGSQNTPQGCKGECDLRPGSPMRGNCMYRPQHLYLMLERLPPDTSCRRGCKDQGMNEIVFDPTAWQRNMPRTIVAMFHKRGAAGEDPRGSVSAMHRKFVAEYGLKGSDVPLLRYEPSDFVQPFSDA